MGSRGQSGRDRAARDIVGQYEIGGIGESKGKILNFFRYMDSTSESEIEDRFQREGEELAEDLSDSMVYRDDQAREEYNTIRRALGGTYTLSDQDRSSIPDFTRYIRSNENFVRIGKSGLPVDSAYEELSERFPGYFPRSVSNPADQLQRINQVMQNLRSGFVRSASDEDKQQAMPYIFDDLARAYNEIRRRRGLRSLQLVTPAGRAGGRGQYSWDDDEELPFF